MGFRTGVCAMLSACVGSGMGLLYSGVAVAQESGQTGEGTGVPRGIIVGLVILTLILLYALLRRSLQSDDDRMSNAWSDSPGESNFDRQRYDSEQTSDPSVAGPNSDRGISAVAHLLSLFGLIPPIVMYIISTDPFVQRNAANALNWQVSWLGYVVLAVLLIRVGLLGPLVIVLLLMVSFAFILVAAYRAIKGVAWSYPFAVDLL